MLPCAKISQDQQIPNVPKLMGHRDLKIPIRKVAREDTGDTSQASENHVHQRRAAEPNPGQCNSHEKLCPPTTCVPKGLSPAVGTRTASCSPRWGPRV